MDDARVFQEAVASDGGRLDTAELPPATAKSYEHLATRARGFLKSAQAALPWMPPIYFDFIDDWKFNAIAFKRNEQYFIGVNRGAVATLLVLFDRILADRRILTFIGDPQLEAEALPLLPNLGASFENTVASVREFSPPRDSSRRSTSNKLVEFAMDFLTGHEFAHVANGHVDHMLRTQGVSIVDELGANDGSPLSSESALASQAKEMDADNTATLISLGCEWGRISGDLLRPGYPWTEFYSYPGRVSFLWSFAVSSLCRIFGDTRLTHEDPMLDSHPPWRLRSVMVQLATGRVPRPDGLKTHSTLVGDRVHRIPWGIRAAHLEVEKAFSFLTGRPQGTRGLDEAWGDVGQSEIDRLRGYWRKKLSKELQVFAYQPLATYGQVFYAEGALAEKEPDVRPSPRTIESCPGATERLTSRTESS